AHGEFSRASAIVPGGNDTGADAGVGGDYRYPHALLLAVIRSFPLLSRRHVFFVALLTLPAVFALGFVGAANDRKQPVLQKKAADDAPVAFKGATIHPAAGPVIDDGVLVVHKGKIVAVGDAKTPIPKDAKVIDVSGKTIIPGLVDTHSHVAISGRPNVSGNSD